MCFPNQFPHVAKDGSLQRMADELRFEHSDAFAFLSGLQISYQAPKGKCPRINKCGICGVTKHSVAWGYRSEGTRKKRKTVACGGTCSCCIYATSIFGCSRSVQRLVQSGAIIAIRKLSSAVRAKRGAKDVCACVACKA